MFETIETPQAERFTLRQIRTVPETVNMTFDFVRAHFGLITRSLLVIAFPPVLIALVLFYKYSVDSFSTFGAMTYTGSYLASTLLLTLAGIVLITIASTMLIGLAHSFVALYLDRGADGFRTVTVRDVWERTKGEFMRLLGTNISLGIIGTVMMIPMVFFPPALLGIPVLFVFGALYFPIRIYERRGIIRSFTLSADLVMGKWWATVGLYILHYLLSTLLSSLLLAPVIVIMILEALGVISFIELAEAYPWLPYVGGAATTLYYGLLFLLYTIPLLSFIFHYFSQRERKSGVGLLADLEKIGSDWSDAEPLPDDRTARETSFRNERLHDA
jgi:hypothetical protein